ncbi:MAG: AtpZ/AtpI family protein [Deltaproteobacteria bacterium]|nr:AtpZ/AtpI family protein [Deltaproteobacteria bacterium]
MSQDSAEPTLHRSVVTPGRGIDPAARTAKRAYDALSASSVGLELGISVILGLLFGWWLDKQLGTAPWMMLLFLVFGLIAGFRGVMRAVGRAERAAEATDRG